MKEFKHTNLIEEIAKIELEEHNIITKEFVPVCEKIVAQFIKLYRDSNGSKDLRVFLGTKEFFENKWIKRFLDRNDDFCFKIEHSSSIPDFPMKVYNLLIDSYGLGKAVEVNDYDLDKFYDYVFGSPDLLFSTDGGVEVHYKSLPPYRQSDLKADLNNKLNLNHMNLFCLIRADKVLELAKESDYFKNNIKL